jgi:hypothetical protein
MIDESDRGSLSEVVVRETARRFPASPHLCAYGVRRAHELEIAMGLKTILVPIEQHDLMNSTLQTALLLARKFDSYSWSLHGTMRSAPRCLVGTTPMPVVHLDSPFRSA